MNGDRIHQAVYNNAVWCDTVCRAHGSPGVFLDGIWINRRETPHFYPNAVTLTKDGEYAAKLAHIRDLLQLGIPGQWGVKDSFCALELASLGFRILFEGEWICREESRPRPEGSTPGVHWVAIEEASRLADWELAWGAGPTGDMHSPPARIFLPSLLMDQDVAIIAAYQDQRIVAGAIASRTEEVVGLSNVFAPESGGERSLAGCIAWIVDAFPGLPIVGYERGSSLAAARAQGFDALGPLRTWVYETR